MQTDCHPSPSLDLDVARREFERWRRGRARGTRIPEALWRTAADIGRRHGVSKTSQALQLDYYALQRRVAEGGCEASGVATQFVDLSLPAVAGVGSCEVEITDQSGGRVRARVSGLSARDLATFVRAVVTRGEP